MLQHSQFENQVSETVRQELNYINAAMTDLEQMMSKTKDDPEVNLHHDEMKRKLRELHTNFDAFSNQFNSLYANLLQSTSALKHLDETDNL